MLVKGVGSAVPETTTAVPAKAVSVADASALIERALDRLFEYKPNPTLAEILASTFGQMESWLPQIGIRVTTGAGKTEAVLRWLQKWIDRCQAEGWPSRVLFLALLWHLYAHGAVLYAPGIQWSMRCVPHGVEWWRS